jgi:ribosomal protein S18 acetylase RimI-like enzyme
VIALRFAVADDAAALAELHAARIDEGFLASLGPHFLGRLYRRVTRSSSAFAVVAEEDEQVVAFCAAAENVRRFYLEFIARDGLVAGLGAAPRIVRALPRVLETARYPATNGSLPAAEILAVGTHVRVANRGLGRAVVEKSLHELSRRGCTNAKVVAGSSNATALRMYERCGFAPQTQISIHDDAPSEVLVWASS